MSLIRALLTRLVESLPPPRVITDRESGGRPYLSRYYLLGRARDDGDLTRKPMLPFNVFLHRFHRSDDDGALHSHPWEWAVSFVLAGGYSEERRVGDHVVRREVRPFSINVIRDDDFHRVDLFEEDAWSLFIAGPKIGTWYFWDRDKVARAPWMAFINELRGEPDDSIWIPDSGVASRRRKWMR